jgi:hypothetical protein
MDDEYHMLFHNYLMRREILLNTFIRFPEQFIYDGDHFIFLYKELAGWTGGGQMIQEHDKCLSDIIVVDRIEKENTPSSEVDITNSERSKL